MSLRCSLVFTRSDPLESNLTWSYQGHPGPAGGTGFPGLDGCNGTKGERGDSGPPGEQGPNGELVSARSITKYNLITFTLG